MMLLARPVKEQVMLNQPKYPQRSERSWNLKANHVLLVMAQGKWWEVRCIAMNAMEQVRGSCKGMEKTCTVALIAKELVGLSSDRHG